jgi:hypothetical protein
MRRTLISASLLLALPAFAGAQHAGTPGAGPVAAVAPHAVASAPHPVARAATATHVATAPVGVHRTHVTGTATRTVNVMSGLRHLPLFPADTSDVPGLGFDYPHLAAVNGGRFGSSFSNRGGVGLGFGGFLLFSPGVMVMEPQPGEGEPTPEEAAAANAPGGENERDLADQFLPSPAPAAPLHDAAEYVFVRRDGGLLFAVAYSWDNGTLRYVTRDGVRRSVTQDALDMDATQQFNEQRGLSFHVPA